ncbi:MAG TPA: hypothetical protein VFO76_12320 [Candidatus Kapabacteria bacterium]|nr:hypothetical protein [Candidatus Kapabacteria bacterium]
MGFQGLIRFKKTLWIVLPILLSLHSDSLSSPTNTKFIASLSEKAPSDWPDTCKWLKQWAGIHPTDEMTAKLQYDTLRMYIERCAFDNFSYSVFGSMNGAVQFMSADTNRFLPYRDWLISVLYLNMNQPLYFCECMNSISTTFQFGKNAYLGHLAVKNYMRAHHPECWGSGDDKEYANDSVYDVQAGYDVNHLPPLDSLGLGFLLKASTPSPTTVEGNYLVSFTSSPNPFKNETHLRFHLNRMAYTTIGIYDVLGHQVWGDGNGRSLEAGDHEVIVDGTLLPEEALYARIETGFGEVRTIRLIRTSEP